MTITNTKDNIFIEGFDDYLSLMSWTNCALNPIHWQNIIYSGKTSEIPEELAREYISFIDNPENNGKDIPFKNYSHRFLGVKTAKESIQSACNQNYCVIYKTF